jgi:hypothetical protein
MLGLGAGALGSWYWSLAVVNPYTLGAWLLTGAAAGAYQWSVLRSAKLQDRLLVDICRLSRLYTEHPGYQDPVLEQEVHKLRRLCSRAGGVAALRFRALDAALAAQGVCQHG